MNQDHQYLSCSHCGSEFMQQKSAVWFQRKEDASTGSLLYMTCSGKTGETSFENSLVENPSTRRSGFNIDFECETCAKITRVSFAQHKGQTLFSIKKAWF